MAAGDVRAPRGTCAYEATFALSGEMLSGFLLRGALARGMLYTGEGMFAYTNLSSPTGDPSSGGWRPIFVMGYATATPPTLEVQSVGTAQPMTLLLGAKLWSGEDTGGRMGALGRVDVQGAVAVVDDVVVAVTDTAIQLVDAKGSKTRLVELDLPVDTIVVSPQFIAWTVTRSGATTAFVVPFARSGPLVPKELGTLRGEQRDPAAAIGPTHVAIGCDLFRLSDGQRLDLAPLLSSPGATGGLPVVGVTADDVYWLDGALRKIPIASLGP